MVVGSKYYRSSSLSWVIVFYDFMFVALILAIGYCFMYSIVGKTVSNASNIKTSKVASLV